MMSGNKTIDTRKLSRKLAGQYGDLRKKCCSPKMMLDINSIYNYKTVPADLIIMRNEKVRERSWRSPGNRNTLSCRPEIIRMLTFRTTCPMDSVLASFIIYIGISHRTHTIFTYQEFKVMADPFILSNTVSRLGSRLTQGLAEPW